MELILVSSVVTALNLIIILIKLNIGRYEDAAIDIGSMYLLITVFGGTQGGAMVATISSFIISLMLLIMPSTIGKIKDNIMGNKPKNNTGGLHV